MSRFKLAARGFLALGALSILAMATAQAADPLAAPSRPRSSWVRLTPAVSPSARAAQAGAYDASTGKVVIFGGFTQFAYLSDTWTFDGNTWTRETPAVSPPARAAGSMVYDSVTQTVVLFGGFNGFSYLGDTWVWDGANSSWTQVIAPSSPPAVTAPIAFTDPANGHADVFGGYDGHFYQSDTWQWTGSTWQQLSPSTIPYARSTAPTALDPLSSTVVMFGGLGNVNPTNTWLWNGSDWSQASPSVQPPLRYDSGAAFDPGQGSVVVFGGGSGGVDLNDLGLEGNRLGGAAHEPDSGGPGILHDGLRSGTGRAADLRRSKRHDWQVLQRYLGALESVAGAGPVVLPILRAEFRPLRGEIRTLHTRNAYKYSQTSLRCFLSFLQGSYPEKRGTKRMSRQEAK